MTQQDDKAITDVTRIGANSGHGHVWERPDGKRMRCGGPSMCSGCAKDKALYDKAPTQGADVGEALGYLYEEAQKSSSLPEIIKLKQESRDTIHQTITEQAGEIANLKDLLSIDTDDSIAANIIPRIKEVLDA